MHAVRSSPYPFPPYTAFALRLLRLQNVSGGLLAIRILSWVIAASYS